MVLQAALAALLSRLGAGTDIAIGTPIAGRTERRWTSWSGSSSTRWCCAPTRRATRVRASCSARVRAATWRPMATRICRSSGWWRCCNPARSLSRHPLFQVMLALQNERRRRRLSWPGWRPALSRSASAQREVRPVGGPAERRGADGRRRGSRACWNIQRPVRSRQRRRRWASGWSGCWRRAVAEPGSRPIGELAILSAAERSHHPAGLERHRRGAVAAADAAGAVRGAGRAHAGGGRGGVRGARR